MCQSNENQQNIRHERIEQILKEINDENLDKIFAQYSNQLFVEADCGINEEEYQFLLELKEVMAGIIVQKYMADRGWFQDINDDWRRWRRE